MLERIKNNINKGYLDIKTKIVSFTNNAINPYYIYSEKHKFLFPVIINKMNVSLKYQILKDLLGDDNAKKIFNNNFTNIHKTILILDDLCCTTNINDEKFNDYVKFAIYENPIEKILWLFDTSNIFNENNIQSYFNDKIIDLHLRKQSSLYNYNEMDYIVDIDSLQYFMKEKFNIKFEILYELNKKFVFEIKNKKLINDFYKDDLDLYNKIKDSNKYYNKIKNQKDKISICMCTYNRPNAIRKTIDSILNQTYINWELIIVDDGGTDNTKEVVESYNDDRIRYYWHRHNFIESRNDCIRLATGKYIKLIDSGDIINNTCLEKLIEIYDNNENIDGILIKNSDKLNLELIKYKYKNYDYPASLSFRRNILFKIKNNYLYFNEYFSGGEDQALVCLLSEILNLNIYVALLEDLNYIARYTENPSNWPAYYSWDKKHVEELHNKYNK